MIGKVQVTAKLQKSRVGKCSDPLPGGQDKTVDKGQDAYPTGVRMPVLKV